MSIDKIINIAATITLLEMMVTIGLGVKLADVLGVARNVGLVLRAALANYVLVPAAAVLLLLVFHTEPLAAVGFLVAAVCPGAPYGPPFTALARGNVTAAVGLMVILAGSSAVVAPLLLQLLVPFVAGHDPVRVNVVKMVGTLVLSQFLPLCVGVFVRERWPALAERLRKPFSRVSLVLNLLLVSTIISVQFHMLANIAPIAYAGMSALLVATVLAGAVLGGRAREERVAMVCATSVRNVGVSLVIATGSFPGTPAITAATAYALFQTILMALAALQWGRLAGRNLAPANRVAS
jgi:BASS family bile acid:Na+ symporter